MLVKKEVQKKVLPVLLLGILFMVVFRVRDMSIGASEEHLVAFVDIQEIFANHPQTEKAEVMLYERARRLQDELEEKALGLEPEEQQILLEEYQEELTIYEQDLIEDVLEEIEEAIFRVAKEKGIGVVLEASQILYGGYDLTYEVLADFQTKNQ